MWFKEITSLHFRISCFVSTVFKHPSLYIEKQKKMWKKQLQLVHVFHIFNKSFDFHMQMEITRGECKFLKCLESCSAHPVISISVKCDLTVEPFLVECLIRLLSPNTEKCVTQDVILLTAKTCSLRGTCVCVNKLSYGCILKWKWKTCYIRVHCFGNTHIMIIIFQRKVVYIIECEFSWVVFASERHCWVSWLLFHCIRSDFYWLQLYCCHKIYLIYICR